jgi:hypothetical protein
VTRIELQHQQYQMGHSAKVMRRIAQPDRASRLPYAALLIAAVILAVVGVM